MFEIPLTDFLKIIAILFAAVGLYLNYWQLRKANNQNETKNHHQLSINEHHFL
jgi:preprotein translocase subunit SecG